MPADTNTLNIEVVVSLKYLSNFRRSLDLLLINCEIELELSWSRNCVISEISRTNAVAANPLNSVREESKTTGATFHINSIKRYVPAITLTINDNITFLENIKQGFKRTIFWNKYWSEIAMQTKNKNLG